MLNLAYSADSWNDTNPADYYVDCHCGDLPEALTYFDEAENRYDALGETNLDLAIDRCLALLTAGLAGEAAQETDTAISRLRPEGGIGFRQAELLFAAATQRLLDGHGCLTNASSSALLALMAVITPPGV